MIRANPQASEPRTCPNCHERMTFEAGEFDPSINVAIDPGWYCSDCGHAAPVDTQNSQRAERAREMAEMVANVLEQAPGAKGTAKLAADLARPEIPTTPDLWLVRAWHWEKVLRQPEWLFVAHVCKSQAEAARMAAHLIGDGAHVLSEIVRIPGGAA